MGDVLAYRDGSTAVLANLEVPAGEYVAMQPIVDAKPNVRDSYVTLLTGEECELLDLEPQRWMAAMPARRLSTDLEKPTSVVLQVDLFASVRRIVDCAQGVEFTPRVTLMDEAKSGWFEGYVDYDRNVTACRPKVYVWYENHPDYPDTPDMSPLARPLAIAGVYDRDGRAYYRTPLLYPRIPANMPYDPMPCQVPPSESQFSLCLPPGEHRLSFTCDEDDPTQQDALHFTAQMPGAIVEGQATRVDLVAY